VEVTTTDTPPEPTTPVVEGATGTADAGRLPLLRPDLAGVGATPLALDTGGRSFHIVTAIEGAAEIQTGAETGPAGQFETGPRGGATGRV